MKAEWTRHREPTETVTIHAFVPLGSRMVTTDAFHGYKDPVNPTVVAVVERPDGRLAWAFLTNLRVIHDEAPR